MLHEMCSTMDPVKLPEYIKLIGPKAFSKKVRVKQRTAESWMRMERRPRPETAQVIVEKTPVTMEGIYG
jgi:hypothetical protein